jgi:putative serine protease PepD
MEGDDAVGAPPGTAHRPGPGPAGRRRTGPGLVAAVAGALLLVTGCTGSGNGDPAAASSSGSSLAVAEQAAYESVIQKVLPSVVEIRSSSGLGSGVVYDGDGDIVTNAHVVGTDQQFEVLAAGSADTFQATLVGSYPANDLAVIKVTGGRGLQPATFADSTKAEVGQIVLAMGNPLGLSATVTNGIISATNRTVSEPPSGSSPGATLPDMLQTSAPINPGNSGGALVDSGRAALGVQVTTVIDRSGRPEGVAVVAVTPGGPAAAAGIQPGDVIVAVNGTETPTAQALGTVLADLAPGQTVTVTIMRGGAQQDRTVTLGEL